MEPLHLLGLALGMLMLLKKRVIIKQCRHTALLLVYSQGNLD
jgi:hypothetical protein